MMILCTVLVIVSCANLVSTDVEDPTEQHEKIAHGVPVYDPGRHPYLVSIQQPYRNSPGGYRHFCGGSLIERQIVVTAAHCLQNPSQIATFRILPNYRNTPYIRPNDRTFKISRYVIHPGYIGSIFKHDIAIILLDQPDARNGATIRLPIAEVPLREPVTIIGFGKVENEMIPNELMSAVVYRLADRECRFHIHPASYIQGFNLCAANAIKSGVCSGDSGGPLIRILNNMHYLQGIASTYYPPCGRNRVTTYVNVIAYLDFINRTILSLTRGQSRLDEFNIQWTQNDTYTSDGLTDVDYA